MSSGTNHRLRWKRVQQLAELAIRAIEPIAKLIDAISRLR
jgi:hypothetical protein